jgi:hypothetical protein
MAAPPRGRLAGRLVFTHPRACVPGYLAGEPFEVPRSRAKAGPFAPGNAGEASMVCATRALRLRLVGRDDLLRLADFPFQIGDGLLLSSGLS